MQETGIVRRIDDLGRVVIPKEMRRTLRLREGDPLEIYANKDQLVFKKYSPISSIYDNAQAVADGIEELTKKVCIITDSDSIIYISKGKYKDFLGKNISIDLENVLKERKSVIISKVDKESILSITDSDDFQAENQIIVPIISGGDCYGAIVVFDREKTNNSTSELVKFVQLGATFLSKNFD